MEGRNPFEMVPPKEGKSRFDKIRGRFESGDTEFTEEELRQLAVPKAKPEKKPLPKPTPIFKTGAGAMDDWQKIKESEDDERWHKAA